MFFLLRWSLWCLYLFYRSKGVATELIPCKRREAVRCTSIARSLVVLDLWQVSIRYTLRGTVFTMLMRRQENLARMMVMTVWGGQCVIEPTCSSFLRFVSMHSTGTLTRLNCRFSFFLLFSQGPGYEEHHYVDLCLWQ